MNEKASKMEGYRHLISAESKTYAVTVQFQPIPCILHHKQQKQGSFYKVVFREEFKTNDCNIQLSNAMGGVGKQQIKSDHVQVEDEQKHYLINNRPIFPRLNLCWEPFPLEVPNLSSSPIVIA